MKNLFLFFACYFSLTSLFSQGSHLILYSENGERFTVVINGIQQNENPETNVRIEDLNANTYKAKIIFEQQNLGEINKTLFFNTPSTQYTYAIVNKKGIYKVRYRSEVSIAQAPPPPPTQNVIVFNATPGVVTQTTTTTTHSNNPNGENISMKVGLGGVGMNVNFNDNTSSTTTTRSTTTTTHHNVIHSEPINNNNGCGQAMSMYDFYDAKSSIEAKDFDNSKLTIAKQIAQSNCLQAQQVKAIMQLFEFEKTRLDFAKFAYAYTFDKGNYFQVNDAFDFKSSVDKLNQHLGL